MNTPLLEINLSTEFERRKVKKANKVQIPAAVGLVIVLCILAFGGFYLYVYFSQQSYNNKLRQYKNIKNDSEESDRLIKQNKAMKEQIAILQKWYDSRITWSEQWRQLSSLIPDDAYLTAIEATKIDARGDSLQVILRGRAFGDQGESVVLDFLNNLKMNSHFSNAYSSIEMGSITSELNEKIFSIEMVH